MKRERKIRIIERIVGAMGSVPSLFAHTLVFIGFFASWWFGVMTLDSMLLILTTLVSLEAIYLSLLIQMTVNENTRALREVEDDIDEIQEDVEGLGEDIEDIQEDIEEISEDIDEIQEDVEEINEDIDEIQEDVEELNEEEVAAAAEATRVATKAESLEKLTEDVRRILADLEEFKKAK